MDLKRILAPTDFSPSARSALEYALFLGKRLGAGVDLLHVWELPIGIVPDWLVQAPGEAPRPASEFVRARAGRDMELLVTELRQGYDNVRGRLEMGDATEMIARVAASDAYDLIVMGTHGRTGLSHLFAGSVAEKVVRLATCPVLTVHHESKRHAC